MQRSLTEDKNNLFCTLAQQIKRKDPVKKYNIMIMTNKAIKQL